MDKTPILGKILHPEEFFEEVIRPELEAVRQQHKLRQAYSYIEADSARKAMEEIIDSLKNIEGVSIRPQGGRPDVVVDSGKSENTLIFHPQKVNFKIKKPMATRYSGFPRKTTLYASV